MVISVLIWSAAATAMSATKPSHHSLSSVSLKVLDMMESGVAQYLKNPGATASPRLIFQQVLKDLSSLKKVLRKMNREDRSAIHLLEGKMKAERRTNAEDFQARKELKNDNHHLEETIKMMVEQQQKCEKSLEETVAKDYKSKEAQDALQRLGGEHVALLVAHNRELTENNTRLHDEIHRQAGELETLKKKLDAKKLDDAEVQNLRLQNKNLMESVRKLMHDDDRVKLRNARQLLEEERKDLQKQERDIKVHQQERIAKEKEESDDMSDRLETCNTKRKNCEAQLQGAQATHTLCADETKALVEDKKHLMDTITNLIRGHGVRKRSSKSSASEKDSEAAPMSAHVSPHLSSPPVSKSVTDPKTAPFPSHKEDDFAPPSSVTNFDIAEMGKTADIDAYVTKAEVAMENEPKKILQSSHLRKVNAAPPAQQQPVKAAPIAPEPVLVLPQHLPQVNLAKLPEESPLREYMGIPLDPDMKRAIEEKKKAASRAAAAQQKAILQHERTVEAEKVDEAKANDHLERMDAEAAQVRQKKVNEHVRKLDELAEAEKSDELAEEKADIAPAPGAPEDPATKLLKAAEQEIEDVS